MTEKKTEKLTKIKLINDKQKSAQLAHVCHQVSSVRPHYQLRRENQTLFIKDQTLKFIKKDMIISLFLVPSCPFIAFS